LLLLPEAFLGGYPRGHTFGMSIGARDPAGRETYYAYYQSCISLAPTSPERRELEAIAKDFNVFLVVGVIERIGGSSIRCAVAMFDPSLGMVARRGKLMPTGSERTVWTATPARREDLKPVEVVLAGQKVRLFAAICWENYMPLLRAAVYSAGRGCDIWLAPTADGRESWVGSMRYIAMEGRMFVVGCNQVVRKREVVPPLELGEGEDGEEFVCRGGGVIFGPLGEELVAPTWEKVEGGVAVIEDLRREIVKSRLDIDQSGHY
ncbi:carbon-nitrogen hydrolase, partial [Ascobolus immersus RN42]